MRSGVLSSPPPPDDKGAAAAAHRTTADSGGQALWHGNGDDIAHFTRAKSTESRQDSKDKHHLMQRKSHGLCLLL